MRRVPNASRSQPAGVPVGSGITYLFPATSHWLLLMNVSDRLRCLFSAAVEEQEESYVVELPKREIQRDEIQANDTYHVAILSSLSPDATATNTNSENDTPKPPVAKGERRTVEIENLGDQGDGLARVERGFVVVIPDTDQGERVTVEITGVRENVAFATVIKRLEYDR